MSPFMWLIRDGSAEQPGRILGLFTPEEIKHYLFEGALGPEFRYTDVAERRSPKHVQLDIAVESVRQETIVPLEQSSELVQQLWRKPTLPSPKNQKQIGQQIEVKSIDFWTLEADFMNNEVVGSWHLTNINYILPS